MKTYSTIPIARIVTDDRMHAYQSFLLQCACQISDGPLSKMIVMHQDDGYYYLLCGDMLLHAAKSLDWKTIESSVYDPKGAFEFLRHELRKLNDRIEWSEIEQVYWGLKFMFIDEAMKAESSKAATHKDAPHKDDKRKNTNPNYITSLRIRNAIQRDKIAVMQHDIDLLLHKLAACVDVKREVTSDA
jgi:hypothetical protein